MGTAAAAPDNAGENFDLLQSPRRTSLIALKPDMLIVPAPNLDALIKAGALLPESRALFGSLSIAMGMREGASFPDISSPEKLQAVLLEAHSIVHSNPKDTPSGAQMARVMEQLGIVEAMQRKTVYRNFLDGGSELLLLKGEADLGFYQKSAMMSVKSVAIAGLVPQSLYSPTRPKTFSQRDNGAAAIFRKAAYRALVRAQ